jgi:ubiquitin-protein ligase
VPRSFRLLEELESAARRASATAPSASYGVDDDDGDDVLTRSWTGTIIGPVNGVHEGRIHQVKLAGVRRGWTAPIDKQPRRRRRRRALPLEVG